MATAHLLSRSVITERIAERMTIDPGTSDADALAEYAGRVCYASENKPNPATRANRDYLRHILDVGHYSVLAHAHCAVEIEDLSRSCTHELIRSVFLGYSQESQRYVRPSLELEAVRPPEATEAEFAEIAEGFEEALQRYYRLYDSAYRRFVDDEHDTPRNARKRAAAVARSVLPNSTPTRIVVSGNLRAWRDFFVQRLPYEAEAEIRDLAAQLFTIVSADAQNTFQDQAEAGVPQRIIAGVSS